MIDWSRLQFLKPAKIWSGVHRRLREGGGLRAAAVHGLRETGTLLDHALVGPMVLRFNPMGYICNHACPMCWLQHLDPAELKRQKQLDRDEGLRLADYERLFASMPPGLETVELVGGGEPLVHPECLEIMAAVKRHKWRGALISNGSLLREPAAQRLVDIDWDFTRISVHAGDAETYRAIQGVDHFETVRANLRTYTRLRTRPHATRQGHLCIFHVLQRENIGQIDRLFAFAEEVGADSLLFEKIIPYDDAKILTPDEVRQAREAVLVCARDSRIPCNLEDVVPALLHEQASLTDQSAWVPGKRCSVGFDQTFINANGDVLPCCFSDEVLGNLRRDSFTDIWGGPRYREFRTRLNRGRFAHYCISNRCTMKGVVHP